MQALTDLTMRADGAASPPDSGPDGDGAGARPSGRADHKLVAGQRWQKFLVTGPVPHGPPNSFLAENANLMEKVVVHATPVTEATVWRRGAWDRLVSLPPHARIVNGIDALEEEGWRYEITRVPPATTVREWIACNKASPESVQIFLQQLSATLAALHAQGVVHLNIRPETIFVEESADEMRIWLGGTHAATLYTQPRIALDGIDPFYAPPEAVDAKEFPPGTGLCAWDWWSVGRVLQEYVLGRHIMAVLFNGDVTHPTPDLVAQAHKLLLESDAMLPRAGAVEKMADIAPQVHTLLSGLLTAARDARWGQNAVQRWLKGENVKHHYHLARDTRLFIWKGRSFTLEEAIDFFTTEENWLAGEENIFEGDKPETLGYFLAHDPAQQPAFALLRSCVALAELPAWQPLPVPLRRTLATSVAWVVLGAKVGKKLPLRIRTAAVDKASLAARLQKPEVTSGLDVVRALTSAPLLALLEPCDAAAAALLNRAARISRQAGEAGVRHQWFEATERPVLARVLALALEADAWLKTKATKVRETYAACRDPQLWQLLDKAQAEPWEQVLAIVTTESAARFGYVTQVEWSRQQAARIGQRSRHLHAAIFWTQLHQMLAAGGIWTGRGRVFAAGWVGAVAVGLGLAQDLLITEILAAVLLLMRLGFSLQVRWLVRKHDSAAPPWTLADGPARCLQELARVNPGGKRASIAELESELEVIRTEAAGMSSPPKDAAPRPRANLRRLRTTIVAGAVATFLVASQFGAGWAQGGRGPDELAPPRSLKHAARLMPANLTEVRDLLPDLSPAMAERVVKGEYEIMNDGFGLQLNGPLRKWTYAPPALPPTLVVSGQKTSSPNQRAWAEVSAGLLLKSFGHGPINALVAVQIPASSGVEMMIYNGRDHQLLDDQSYRLDGPLTADTWYRLGRRQVVFLGAPEGVISELRTAGFDTRWLESL